MLVLRTSNFQGATIRPLSFTTKFSPILIGLNRSRDAIVFIGGERLSAHSAPLRKMPGWIVTVRGKCLDG